MNHSFKPRLDVLPLEQQQLWSALRPAASLGYTLYGGTAIALRLGHRESVDFDFFSAQALDRKALLAAFQFLVNSTTLQDQGDAWVVLAPANTSSQQRVKLSFFGPIAFGRVGEPDFTEDGVLRVASLDDLMATKLKVILQRAEAKDYRDIAAMINAGISLARGLASARLLFGSNFQPSESLKALVYFNDGDLGTLSHSEKQTLVDEVKRIRELPQVSLISQSLSA